MEGWTLHLVEPSHFHAALLLQRLDSRIIGHILIHAGTNWNEAPFLQSLHCLETCNWDLGRLKIARSQDPIAELLRDHGRPLALLACENSLKADWALRLLLGNVPVLCDKPLWINATTGKGLSDFLRITNQDIFLDDCMTERFEPVFELQKLLLTEKLPGFEIRSGPNARVRFHLGNTHNLAKTVAGVPVGRERAFFQIERNGDPFSDVGVHLVDHYLRLMTALGISTTYLDRNPGKVESDCKTIDPQSLSLNSGTNAIPFPIKQIWQGGNGPSMSKIDTEWLPAEDQPTPENQSAIVHGECGSLAATFDIPTNSMVLDLVGLPVGERFNWIRILRENIAKFPEPWPHTKMEETRFGIRMIPPQSTRLAHSARFPKLFEQFLNRIQQNRPLSLFERQKLLLKYAITANSNRQPS